MNKLTELSTDLIIFLFIYFHSLFIFWTKIEQTNVCVQHLTYTHNDENYRWDCQVAFQIYTENVPHELFTAKSRGLNSRQFSWLTSCDLRNARRCNVPSLDIKRRKNRWWSNSEPSPRFSFFLSLASRGNSPLRKRHWGTCRKFASGLVNLLFVKEN